MIQTEQVKSSTEEVEIYAHACWENTHLISNKDQRVRAAIEELRNMTTGISDKILSKQIERLSRQKFTAYEIEGGA